MNSSINSSPNKLPESIRQQILDKYQTVADPSAVMLKANQEFSKVATRLASGGAEQDAAAGHSDPNAPKLPDPDPNAIKDAVRLIREEIRKSSSTAQQKQPQTEGKTQAERGANKEANYANSAAGTERASETDRPAQQNAKAEGHSGELNKLNELNKPNELKKSPGADDNASRQRRSTDNTLPAKQGQFSGSMAKNHSPSPSLLFGAKQGQQSQQSQQSQQNKGSAPVKESAGTSVPDSGVHADVADSSLPVTAAGNAGTNQAPTQTQAPAPAKGGNLSENLLSNDEGGEYAPDSSSGADTPDTNSLTKFVGNEGKSKVQNRDKSENRAVNQRESLQNNAVAKEGKFAVDSQLAANAVQTTSAAAVLEEEQSLADDDRPLSSRAAMSLLFGKVLELLDSNSVEKMMGTMQAMASANNSTVAAFQASADAIAGMTDDNAQLQGELSSAEETLNGLKQASADAAAAAADNPNDADLQAKAAAAASAVTTQEGKVAVIKDKLVTNFNAIADANEKFHGELSAWNASHNYPETGQMQQDVYTSSAKMALIMAQFMADLDTDRINKMNTALKKSQAIDAARIAESQKSLAEAVESKRKSDAMGCIMKLVAALVTAISFVAAIFTGGASLVFAAAALAILVVDTVLEAAGAGFTIMGSFMDSVMKPIMEGITKAVTAVLELVADAIDGIAKAGAKALGLPEPEPIDRSGIKMASAILGAIVVAIGVVAMMVGGMGAAGSKMLSSIASKAVPNLVKSLASNATQYLSKMVAPIMKSLSAATEVSVATLQTATKVVTTGVQAATSVGVGIPQAVYTEELNKALAKSQFEEQMQRQFGSMIAKSEMELFTAMRKFLTEFQEMLLEVTSSRGKAAKAILSGMKPIAS